MQPISQPAEVSDSLAGLCFDALCHAGPGRKPARGCQAGTVIGIPFAAMFALGLRKLSMTSTFSIDVEDLLLGQIRAISPTGIYVSQASAALPSLGLLVLVVSFHKSLLT